MKIVVDTNILFSFFRENPVRSILLSSSSLGLEFFCPDLAIEELEKKSKQLSKYAGVKETEIRSMIGTLRYIVKVVPEDFFSEFALVSKKITPDQKDAPFFALALKLDASIWTNEPRLKRQSKVPVLSTANLREKLGV